jgi:predicted SAM-dependent methyltransferase
MPLSSSIIYPRTRFRTARSVQRDIDALLTALRSRAELGLHLGAGSTRIAGLVNCDLHNPAADRKVDATELGEFADASVDHVETHHMLEHLSFADGERAIAEWARVLKPGAHLVITCPDLTALCRKWLYQRLFSAFFKPRHEAQVLEMFYGTQEHTGMLHRSGYDRRVLQALLERHGLRCAVSYTPYPRRPTPSLLMVARKDA